MQKEVKVRLKQRTDSATNWTASNPVLLVGEFGVEKDSGKFKIGDGTTSWNSLAYAPGCNYEVTVLKFVSNDEINKMFE